MYSKNIIESIQSFHSDLIAIRHDIHAHPELGFEEARTSALVAEKLADLGCEVHRNIGKTGVVGVLHGKKNTSGKSIGLRADMDALPILETGKHDYASTHSGVMHACGHDGHTTMLLGAARYLCENRDFNGTVNFIFQPAEEGRGGGKAMVEDGLFERFPCDAIYGQHNSPELPAGMVGVATGPAMAAADFFDIHIKGHGGHGAYPFQTKDPIIVAAQLVTALQTIISRNVPPLESAVVTIAAVQAGNLTGKNVIPGDALLCGTVRTFSQVVQDQVIARMKRIIEGIAAAFDVEIELSYNKIYPATINRAEHAAIVAQVATGLFGKDKVVENLTPTMGAEDFAYMLQKCPGAYYHLGQGGADEGRGLHTSGFNFNDAIIPTGSAMFCALVQHHLPPA